MEQAYRKLIKELGNHRLVESVSHNYYEIKVHWKSGIKERLVLNRPENNKYKRISYLKSPVYRPWFVPKATWWEQISNGFNPQPNYLNGVNDIEFDVSEYPFLINWNWSDVKKSYFFERLILVHEILDFIIDKQWKDIKYPTNFLVQDLESILKDDLSLYKMKSIDFYCLRRKKPSPGSSLIKHFFPYGDYGYNNPSYLFKCDRFSNIKRIYLAIKLIFKRNYASKKKGIKRSLDINYENILKTMKNNNGPAKPYKSKQIGMYRRIIKDLSLSGQSFFDIDPFLGERSLAAYAEQCPYFYNPTCPFDEYCHNLGEFLNFDFIEDDQIRRYDFSIYDSEEYSEELFEEVYDIMSRRVDTGIIYIKNMHYDKFKDKHKPDEYFNMKTSRMFQHCGKWMVFRF